MLNLVKDETERIDSRFLEPACGSGNFLVPIVRRKLAAVELKDERAGRRARRRPEGGGMSVVQTLATLPRVRSAKQGRAGTHAERIMSHPLAYHLIWTTYGTWLPGDARGWIKAGVLGIQEPDPALEQRARDMMAESEVRLTPEQRAAVEQTIRKHCQIRNWTLHGVNVRSNHVHVVVTCPCDGEKARDELKLWGSRCLSDLAGLTTPVARKAGRRHWWTEKGECKAIDTPEYLENAVQYVTDLQGA